MDQGDGSGGVDPAMSRSLSTGIPSEFERAVCSRTLLGPQ